MSDKAIFVNALTFSRVPLIFAWLVLAVVQEHMTPGNGRFWMAWGAGLMMGLSGLTDLFDGKLARKWNVVSTLGKMADPLMLAFTILYILRDLWVTFMRSIGTMYGANVAAMWIGKVRTALSFPAAGWVYAYLTLHLFLPEASVWREVWLWSCYGVEAFMIILNVVSCCSYTREYLPYLKKALERN